MRKGEAAKLGDAGIDSGASAAEANYPPPANRSASPRVAALPEPTGVAVPPPAAASAHRPGATMPRAAAVPVQAKPIAAGATIEVAAGDTLYGIAKRHAVPVNELMTVNNLTSPTIKPGQKLVLPASVRSPVRGRCKSDPARRAGARCRDHPGRHLVAGEPVRGCASSGWCGTLPSGLARTSTASLAPKIRS
jgi:LysM repeat protein